MVSIHGPLGYGPSTLKPRHSAYSGATDGGIRQVCLANSVGYEQRPITIFLRSLHWHGGGDSSVDIATGLRDRRSGDRIPVATRFSAPVQTNPGAHPTSCTMGTGSLPGVKRPGRSADHQAHFKRRVWRKSRAIHLLRLWAFAAFIGWTLASLHWHMMTCQARTRLRILHWGVTIYTPLLCTGRKHYLLAPYIRKCTHYVTQQ